MITLSNYKKVNKPYQDYEIKYRDGKWMVYVPEKGWREFPSGWDAFVYADLMLNPSPGMANTVKTS